jgi:stearoyl-CoA desaturase (delta-9 desaturase)
MCPQGGQKGPLWWSSKHARHHKFCENQGDPHSVLHYGFWYGFAGWIAHPYEWHIDWDYVHPSFKTWEMLLCESLTAVVGFGEPYLCWRLWGVEAGGGRHIQICPPHVKYIYIQL